MACLWAGYCNWLKYLGFSAAVFEPVIAAEFLPTFAKGLALK
jgi:hypothetical protein